MRRALRPSALLAAGAVYLPIVLFGVLSFDATPALEAMAVCSAVMMLPLLVVPTLAAIAEARGLVQQSRWAELAAG